QEGAAGWHCHKIGGYYDESDEETSFVEAICVAPNPRTQTDDLWMVVSREIDGSDVLYLEYITKEFRWPSLEPPGQVRDFDNSAEERPVFMDSAKRVYQRMDTLTLASSSTLVDEGTDIISAVSV